MNAPLKAVSGHTPGPWRPVAQDGPKGSCFMAQVFGQNGRAIADVETTTHQDEATANARLIAAAPDLLEVFSEVLEKIDFDKGAKGGGFEDEAELLLIRARAAIAKATGAA